MRLSEKTLKVLAGVLSRGTDDSPSRNIEELIDLFDFGDRDLNCPDHLPTAEEYSLIKLRQFNGSENMKGVFERLFCPDPQREDAWDDPMYNQSIPWDWGESGLEEVAGEIDKFLREDGFKLIPERYFIPSYYGGYYHVCVKVRPLHSDVINSDDISPLDSNKFSEDISKIRRRINDNDHSGAITVSSKLIESVAKELYKESGGTNARIEKKGNLVFLIKSLFKLQGIDPDSEKISDSQKLILNGILTAAQGVFDIANSRGDKHVGDGVDRIPKHHAILVANIAFSICNFLIESHRYQVERSKKGIK